MEVKFVSFGSSRVCTLRVSIAAEWSVHSFGIIFLFFLSVPFLLRHILFSQKGLCYDFDFFHRINSQKKIMGGPTVLGFKNVFLVFFNQQIFSTRRGCATVLIFLHRVNSLKYQKWWGRLPFKKKMWGRLPFSKITRSSSIYQNGKVVFHLP